MGLAMVGRVGVAGVCCGGMVGGGCGRGMLRVGWVGGMVGGWGIGGFFYNRQFWMEPCPWS